MGSIRVAKRIGKPTSGVNGFTLTELLVGIALVTLLLGLTLNAVMQARQSALRTLDIAQWKHARKQGTAVPRTAPLRVLFIGNSYTEYNRLPEMIAALARSTEGDAPLEFDSQLVGGATLEQHWNDGVALEKIQEGSWDFVVLQEQSLRPIVDRTAMHEYGDKFITEIKDRDAFPLLYLTWARQNVPKMQNGLNSGYFSLARKRSVEVAPVGMAWAKSLENAPQLILHDADASHPNPTGSYLAACVFFATFYGRSPEGLPGRLESDGTLLIDLSDAEARPLQIVAWEAIRAAKTELSAN